MQKNDLTSLVLCAIICAGCSGSKKYDIGSYGYDARFLNEHQIDFVELVSNDGLSKVMVVPSLQGRVMTSSANGNEGDSYGWINYRFICSGEVNPQFNPVGGEERFWFGPEGGPYSLYFEKGVEQVYENWKVPPVIDTEPFDVVSQQTDKISFTKQAVLRSASDTEFSVKIDRSISLLGKEDIENDFGIQLSGKMKIVAYQTENTITNTGEEIWSKERGLISIWMLGMFNPTPTTTVFIPYDIHPDGIIVNDAYFGEIPRGRLIAENGMIYFRIDGKHRSKIGIPPGRAKELCGSYDSEKNVLTLLWYSLPESAADYVNGQWGKQENPYAGDVINSYNDGPVANGSVMGPFYEIETSSPGAELLPGGSLIHTQKIIHLEGEFAELEAIVTSLFNVKLQEIAGKFKP